MAVPMGASANHRGCTVTPNAPTCTYTAAGGEIARGGASSTASTSWQASVVRDDKEVVLAGASSLTNLNPEGHPVPALAGEVVTVRLIGGTNGVPVGFVTVGTETGH
ncbi:MAG TPA: hypothetical protein VM600_07625 [Actinomycetota bacterium]|nr:hypothetical protein [Actinomycetota bacterium]